MADPRAVPAAPDVELSADPARLRLEQLQPLLAATFWTPGITAAEIERGIEHSALVVGAYLADGRQVGFLRVISDCVRFAYLLDVVVDAGVRRQGIGQAMVRFALEHPRLRDVYQWLLVTRDAHGVYAKCGFRPLDNPEKWMAIRRERPDRSRFP